MEIETIIFDLDDTLYPSSSGIWALIRARIDKFMIEKLDYTEENVPKAREKFFLEYGTTLRGLESVHNIDTIEYLKFVHEIPLDQFLYPNEHLQKILKNLSQRKVIFTNGDRWHSRRATDALKISQYFDQVIDILDVSPYCKPMKQAFEIALKKLEITETKTAILIDDNIRNIQAAKSLGMKAIFVAENGHNVDTDIIKIKKIEELDQVFPLFEKASINGLS